MQTGAEGLLLLCKEDGKAALGTFVEISFGRGSPSPCFFCFTYGYVLEQLLEFDIRVFFSFTSLIDCIG